MWFMRCPCPLEGKISSRVFCPPRLSSLSPGWPCTSSNKTKDKGQVPAPLKSLSIIHSPSPSSNLNFKVTVLDFALCNVLSYGIKLIFSPYQELASNTPYNLLIYCVSYLFGLLEYECHRDRDLCLSSSFCVSSTVHGARNIKWLFSKLVNF